MSSSAEETAAVVAVLTVLEEQRRAAASASRLGPGSSEHLNVWVDASRRSAQRAGLQRGPWRLSGRVARRSRA